MAIPESFLGLTEHLAPGLHFPAHRRAECGEYTLPALHSFAPPATETQLAWLRQKTVAYPTLQRDLLDFYARWNGVVLCCAPDALTGEPTPLLTILPIEQWDEFTEELTTGDLAWMLDDLEQMYVSGRSFVIAVAPSEGTRLVLFLEGVLEGEKLAGKVFYISMDPVLSFTEPVANSFPELLHQFGTDPAAFLDKIGSTSAVSGKGGYYGAVADRYLADCGLRLDEDEPPDQISDEPEPEGPTLFD